MNGRITWYDLQGVMNIGPSIFVSVVIFSLNTIYVTSPQDAFPDLTIVHLLRACGTMMVLTWLLGNTKDTSFKVCLFT
jgi:hypothetical protein